jgi:hypothetical protein
MKIIKTYLAFTPEHSAYICEAYNKKQMKAAGINMKLEWREVESFKEAKNECLCSGYEVKNASNVTNFKY